MASPVEAARKVVEEFDVELQPAIHESDLGNARRLVARHGEDLRYCYPWKSWLTWDGTRWISDSTGEVVRRAKDTIQSIYTEASKIEDEQSRKKVANHALKSESKARIDAMVELAASERGTPYHARRIGR